MLVGVVRSRADLYLDVQPVGAGHPAPSHSVRAGRFGDGFDRCADLPLIHPYAPLSVHLAGVRVGLGAGKGIN